MAQLVLSVIIRLRVENDEEDELHGRTKDTCKNHPSRLAFAFGKMVKAPEEGYVLNKQGCEGYTAEHCPAENSLVVVRDPGGNEHRPIHEKHHEPNDNADDGFGPMSRFHVTWYEKMSESRLPEPVV
jgi:hypothetical protein